MSKSRDIGTGFETRCARYFKDIWPRIRRVGSRDYGRGDLDGVPSFMIECKADSVWGKASLDKWTKQAEAARVRHGKRWKVIFIRRKHRAMDETYVVLSAREWKEMCKEYGIK